MTPRSPRAAAFLFLSVLLTLPLASCDDDELLRPPRVDAASADGTSTNGGAGGATGGAAGGATGGALAGAGGSSIDAGDAPASDSGDDARSLDAPDAEPPRAGGCLGNPTATRDGHPCGCDQDCHEDGLCVSEDQIGAPGGSCVHLCDPASTTNQCSAGAKCVRYPQGSMTGLCFPTCATSADCPRGRACNARDGTCQTLCTSNAECSSGNCNLYSGECNPAGLATPGGGLMAPCSRGADCKSLACSLVVGRCLTLCRLSKPACPEGGVCVADDGFNLSNDVGTCVPPCAAGGTCAEPGLACRAVLPRPINACGPATGTGCLGGRSGELDTQPCNCAADCGLGSGCAREALSGFPHGACLRYCRPGDGRCAPGFQCLGATGTQPGFCQKTCTTDADCPASRVCSRDGAQNATGTCEPLCQSDAECQGGHCNLQTALCQPDAPGKAVVGAACTAASECQSGYCRRLTPAGDAGVGASVCTVVCDRRKQVCPTGTTCTDDGDGDNAGLCLPGS